MLENQKNIMKRHYLTYYISYSVMILMFWKKLTILDATLKKTSEGESLDYAIYHRN
jgi:hypothetical protein